MENDYADAPAGPVSRPAGPDGPAADPGAGNQAFVETRLQAEAFRGKLMDERKVLQLDYDTHNAALLRLEELEAAGEITEKGIADRTALAARRDQLFKDLSVTNQDLLMLDDASIGLGPLNDMMVRRGTKAYVPQQNETTEGGTQLGPDGIVTKKPGWVETDVTNGVSTTRSHSTTSTIDTSGWSTKTTDSTATLSKTAEGALNSTSNSKTSGLAIGPGGITGTWGEQSGSSSTTAAGVTTSSSTTTSQSLGTGGYTKSAEVKDDKTTRKDTFGVSRGGGQLGVNSSSSTTTDGQETKTSKGGGLLAGPDGVGATGNIGKSTSTEKDGVKSSRTSGLDGKFLLDVAKVEGEPLRYQITMTINLGGKLGATESQEEESATTGAKGNMGGSLSGSISGTATFVHIYPEEQTKRYLGAVDNKTGSEKELQIIKLVADGKLDAAKALMTGLNSALSPEAASQLDDGGSASFEVAGSVEGGGEAGASGGGFGAKGGLSGKASKSLKRSLSRKGDKISITTAETDSESVTGSASASSGAASMGVSGTKTDKHADAVTFELDRTDPAYAQHFAEISGRMSIAALRAYGAEHPKLIASDTATTGTEGSQTTTAGVGGVNLSFSNASGFETTTTKDAKGTTETNTGKAGGGAELDVAGLVKVGHSEKTAVSTTIDPGGSATGDLSRTTSDTDLGATATKYAESFKKSPIASTVGLVTGASKPAEEKTEVIGMKLADSDFDRIFGAAQDPVGWGRPVARPRDRSGWMGLRSRIVAAGNDHKQIARLIAHYGDGVDDAPTYLASIVRGVGRTDGGAVYEWPGELSAEKAVFAKLVEDDSVAPVLALEGTGKNKDALELVTTTTTKLDKLATDMLAKKNEFSEGAFGEMMVRLSDRRRALAGRAYLINQRVATGGPDALATMGPPTKEQSDQETAEVAKATAKVAIDGHKQALTGFEAAQGAQFWIIQKELARRDDWFGKPSVIDMEGAFSNLRDKVYPPWRDTLTKIREAAKQAGLDENEAAKPEPNKLYCNHLHQQAFGNDMFKL
ncbi:hypothetical protein GCM10009745_12370 [Kribbella yunnanensis]|uniref:Uncharacterized protein n=1 Tax=Kribbella yunnanensis TaxID=190194 RepID=A0ABN2GHY3_9ACTN